MSTDLCKLLDNHWQVLLMKQVDGNYCAAAKHRHRESWKDVFECVDKDGQPCGWPLTDEEKTNYSGPRMPQRIASGSTPDEAIDRLCSRLFIRN